MADNLPDVYIKFDDADPEIRGESTDAAYPGNQGYLCIQSFSFGFGWGGAGSSSAANLDDLRNQMAAEEDAQKRKQLSARINALEKERRDARGSAKKDQKGGKNGKDSGAQLKPKEFTFTKSPGVASKDLLLNLQKGPNKALAAELIVCRAAGVDIPNGPPKDAKIPFLKFIFSKIQLTKCQMSISKDQPVSETVEFWFDEVKMETIWTDNETGEKIAGGKNTISFDFGNKDSEPQFEGFLDVD